VKLLFLNNKFCNFTLNSPKIPFLYLESLIFHASPKFSLAIFSSWGV